MTVHRKGTRPWKRMKTSGKAFYDPNDPNFPSPAVLTLESSTHTIGVTVNMPAERPDGDLYVAITGLAGPEDSPMVADPAWGVPLNTLNDNKGSCAVYAWIGSSEPATYTIATAGAFQHADINTTIVRISGSTGSIDASNMTIGSAATCPDATASASPAIVLRGGVLFAPDTQPAGYTIIAGALSGPGLFEDDYILYQEDSPSVPGAVGASPAMSSFPGNGEVLVTVIVV